MEFLGIWWSIILWSAYDIQCVLRSSCSFEVLTAVIWALWRQQWPLVWWLFRMPDPFSVAVKYMSSKRCGKRFEFRNDAVDILPNTQNAHRIMWNCVFAHMENCRNWVFWNICVQSKQGSAFLLIIIIRINEDTTQTAPYTPGVWTPPFH